MESPGFRIRKPKSQTGRPYRPISHLSSRFSGAGLVHFRKFLFLVHRGSVKYIDACTRMGIYSPFSLGANMKKIVRFVFGSGLVLLFSALSLLGQNGRLSESTYQTLKW